MNAHPLPAAADARYLTQILRRAGALGDGRVVSVSAENHQATRRSRVMRLRLSLEGDAARAPASLICKASLPDGGGDAAASRREVAFYAQAASVMPSGFVPHCFDAVWDGGARSWHLLLQDLSETHAIATPWPLPPGVAQCASIVEARARFHAWWWDNPRLGHSVGQWQTPDAVAANLRGFAAVFAHFAARYPELLPPPRHELYAGFIKAAPRLLARCHSRRHMTVAHGDSHVWNCFLPRASDGAILMFDWEEWSINTGTTELAYMMAMHWYPDRRRRMETPLLDRYHTALEAHGVENYSRRALAEDYRLSALMQIARPVLQEAQGVLPRVWWNNFERAMMAADDLGCRELLG